MRGGCRSPDRPGDGVHQMRLAQAHAAIEEERIEARKGRPLRHPARAGMGEFVGLADHEGVEGETPLKRRHPVGARFRRRARSRPCRHRRRRCALPPPGAPPNSRPSPGRPSLPTGIVRRSDRPLRRRPRLPLVRHRRAAAALRNPDLHAAHRGAFGMPQRPQPVAVMAVHPVAHEARGQQDDDLIPVDAMQRHLPQPALVLAVAHLLAQAATDLRPAGDDLRGCLGGQRADLLFHSSHLSPDRCPLRAPSENNPTARGRVT